jgi:alpha-tubulin suppressor-like RCC1 family protein
MSRDSCMTITECFERRRVESCILMQRNGYLPLSVTFAGLVCGLHGAGMCTTRTYLQLTSVCFVVSFFADGCSSEVGTPLSEPADDRLSSSSSGLSQSSASSSSGTSSSSLSSGSSSSASSSSGMSSSSSSASSSSGGMGSSGLPSSSSGGGCGTGPSCPQPFSGHGQSACVSGGCQVSCNPGYRVCASACCAEATLSAGWAHTCAVTALGQVKCWGFNSTGQLGDGTLFNRRVPVDTVGGADATDVATGLGHTCLLTRNGGVKCWGDNEHGQLGNGSLANSKTPVDVAAIVRVVLIATGQRHSCAITVQGNVKCWGDNRQGQLGNNTTASSPVPVDVVGLADASALALGGEHSCALTKAGVKCWGNGGGGQLGIGFSSSLIPTDVPGLVSGVNGIAGGFTKSCALLASGRVKCWGYGSDGLGVQPMPTDLQGPSSTPVSLSLGDEHGCAMSASTVECWGRNRFGQLGKPVLVEDSAAPQMVEAIGSVNELSAGGQHTCVRKGTRIDCWGRNIFGQLGNNGFSEAQSMPTQVVGF